MYYLNSTHLHYATVTKGLPIFESLQEIHKEIQVLLHSGAVGGTSAHANPALLRGFFEVPRRPLG